MISEDGKCRVYASFDLDAFESKEVRVNFAGKMKQMFPQIPGIITRGKIRSGLLVKIINR